MIASPPQPIADSQKRESVSFQARFSRALSRLLVKLKVDEIPHIKRIIVTVVGGTVLIFGFLLIFTPGPAVLVIPAGLAILGTEYAWARRWMRKARMLGRKAVSQTQKIIELSDKEKEIISAAAPSSGRTDHRHDTEHR